MWIQAGKTSSGELEKQSCNWFLLYKRKDKITGKKTVQESTYRNNLVQIRVIHHDIISFFN